jgi:NSS family neurotransmitter:Na+ symporter
MPMGQLFGAFFFASVLFAGITSLINMFEVCSEAVQSRTNFKRKFSVVLIGVLVFAVGLFLEYEPYMGQWMDMITIYVVPIGAVLGAIMIYWVLGKENIEKELNTGREKPLGNVFFWVAKYFYVFLAAIVVILSIIYGGIG